MKPTRWAAALIVATPLLAGALAAQEAPADTIAIGRLATEYFYDGEADSLWAMLTPSFQEKIGAPEKILERLDLISDRAGTEVEVIEESIRMRNGRPQYWRVAEFDMAPEPILLRWVISPEGKISGQGIGLASQAPATDD